jgi:hypothetical protein
MRRLLQGFLVLFGVIVVGISLAHFAIGPNAIIGGGRVNPTSDGEDRFYAGLFLCYGLGLLWCARGGAKGRLCHGPGRGVFRRRNRAVDRAGGEVGGRR